jgi:ADP-heptose:LPS heptosyltransferase
MPLKKILVIQTASIGDVILTTPVIGKLHHSFPEASVDLLVKKGMEGLFHGHPFIHEVLTWDKSHGKYKNFLRILAKIRKARYDVVVNVQRFALTGILVSLSGSKVRIGFSKNPFSFFFTESVPHIIREGMHETERNLMLIESVTDRSVVKPRLYPTATDAAKTAVYKSLVYYTISPASLWFTKQFPAEKWLEFISYIPSSHKVYFLGSENDFELCEGIIRRSLHPGCVNLAGKLGFLESASLMKDARMNFTNDSAPLHLASGVNAPVTVIYCSTVPGFGFGPLSDDSQIVEIKEPLSCRPCGLHGYRSCPEKHFRCATNIDVDQLLARL